MKNRSSAARARLLFFLFNIASAIAFVKSKRLRLRAASSVQRLLPFVIAVGKTRYLARGYKWHPMAL